MLSYFCRNSIGRTSFFLIIVLNETAVSHYPNIQTVHGLKITSRYLWHHIISSQKDRGNIRSTGKPFAIIGDELSVVQEQGVLHSHNIISTSFIILLKLFRVSSSYPLQMVALFFNLSKFVSVLNFFYPAPPSPAPSLIDDNVTWSTGNVKGPLRQIQT